MENLLTNENLQDTIQKLRLNGKKIVFTNGCFDILHSGHVRYLNESKKFGDILLVGLNSDFSVKSLKGESRPINGQLDRAEVLLGLKAVDYVVIFDEKMPEKLLRVVKPDIYTKGADYTVETLPEAKVVIENGGKVEFISLVEGKSTTKIIDKIK